MDKYTSIEMSGPRKTTIAKKLTAILDVLKSSKYQDAVKVKKATEKAASLVEAMKTTAGKKKAARPSEYQKFMKAELAKLKSNTSMSHTEKFAAVARKWKLQNKDEAKKPAAKKPAVKRAAKKKTA